jgi:hypothetical protein
MLMLMLAGWTSAVAVECVIRDCVHRGSGRNVDKDQALERKARHDAEARRASMLSPEELKRQLHCWVAHDSRWVTFKAWIEVCKI